MFGAKLREFAAKLRLNAQVLDGGQIKLSDNADDQRIMQKTIAAGFRMLATIVEQVA